MFQDQIVLKQDPINGVPTEVAEKPFKAFHDLRVEKVKPPGQLHLLRFEIVTLAPILWNSLQTVIGITCVDPCKDLEPIPMDDLCYFSQDIVDDRGIFSLEINPSSCRGVANL